MSAPISILHHWLYVAPASILAGPTNEQSCQPEGELTLREEASTDGLCWVRVIRRLACGDLYQAYVAASPNLVDTDSFLIFLTEEQLRFTLPWDARLQGRKSTDGTPDAKRILPVLYAHHAAIQPAVCHPISQTSVEMPMSQPATTPPVQEDEGLTPLPPVFVSEKHMKKVLRPELEKAMSASAGHHAGIWGRLHSWLHRYLFTGDA